MNDCDREGLREDMRREKHKSAKADYDDDRMIELAEKQRAAADAAKLHTCEEQDGWYLRRGPYWTEEDAEAAIAEIENTDEQRSALQEEVESLKASLARTLDELEGYKEHSRRSFRIN